MNPTYPYASESQHACNPTKTMSTLQDMLAVSAPMPFLHFVLSLGSWLHWNFLCTCMKLKNFMR